MRFILFLNQRCHKRTRCDECLNCLNPKLLKRFGCLGGKDNAATPAKKREVDRLQWGLDSAAEHRSPSETKAVPSSVRNSRVTGSQKKAKPNEKQTLDPKSGGQSQLKQLEAKMKEQMQQLQNQVAGSRSCVCLCLHSPLIFVCCSCAGKRMSSHTAHTIARVKFWHRLRCLQRRTEIEAGRWGGHSRSHFRYCRR